MVKKYEDADGRFVAFESNAENFSPDRNNSFSDVFRQDLVGPPPGCSDVTQAVAHDVATTVALPCADADGDPVTRAIVGAPAHGTLGPIDQVSGTVRYTPDAGYAGPDSFRFQGADASGASNGATARLTVAAATAGGGGGATGGGPLAFGARTLVTFKLAARRIPATGPLKIRVTNGNGFAVTGRLAGRTTKPVSAARKRRIALKPKPFSLDAKAKTTVKLKLPTGLRRLLRRTGKLSLRLTAKVNDPSGNTRTMKRKVTPRLNSRHKRSR
jgi:hypothetical protein